MYLFLIIKVILVQVLSENISYIVTTLGLEGVDLALPLLGEKGENCRPGAPIIAFRTEPSVTLKLTNNQLFTGFLTLLAPYCRGTLSRTSPGDWPGWRRTSKVLI